MGIIAMFAAIVIVSLAAFSILIFCFNLYNVHNVHYTDEDGNLRASKLDGVFAYTEIIMYKNGKVTVTNNRFLRPMRMYSDDNGDGRVDSLFMKDDGRGHRWLNLYRGKHFLRYWRHFDEADKDLKKQLGRFSEYLN